MKKKTTSKNIKKKLATKGDDNFMVYHDSINNEIFIFQKKNYKNFIKEFFYVDEMTGKEVRYLDNFTHCEYHKSVILRLTSGLHAQGFNIDSNLDI